MIITRHAPAFFKLQVGDLVVAINPPTKSSSIKSSRFGADIVLQSIKDSDFNGGEEMNLGGKNPFVISGPGEYEIRDIIIKGFPGQSNYNKLAKINTIYTLAMDSMKLCFLGFESSKNLSNEAKAGLNEIDILLVGFGQGNLSASEAYKLAVSLEPGIIIPIFQNDSDLKSFLKEGGSSAGAEEKLTLKRKDLEGKEGEVMLVKVS